MTPGRKVALLGGIAGGSLFAVVTALLGLLGGSERFAEHWGVSVLYVAGGYFACGFGAGLIVMIMLPLAERRVGAAFVGYVAALPLALLAAFTLAPRQEWLSTGIPTAALVACVGAVVGVYFWKELHGSL
jgi:hypothetical protein